jgi:hypothetical protein
VDVMSTRRHSAPDIRISDVITGYEVGRCTGPSADGRCPRVALGDILPCSGYVLVPANAHDTQPYTVSSQMTLCPVTVALALAVESDTALLAA